MKTSKVVLILNLALFVCAANLAQAQVSKETLDSISTPNKVDTQIGTLEFTDGAPNAATLQKVYDSVDYLRGIDAFMDSHSLFLAVRAFLDNNDPKPSVAMTLLLKDLA